jgi:MFS family permease
MLRSTWGFINSFGLFQTYYTTALRQPASSISWIGSLQIFVPFLIGALSGRATDAGFFRLVFVVGMSVQLVGIFMTSLCTTYWQVFLAQGICVGLGNGLVFIPSITICSTYFLKNRALALGVAASGSATGGLVYPAIAESLLPRVGFGWTVRVMGLVMATTMVFCAVFMKPRLPPRRAGPLVEWAAFKELPYALFAMGSFLMFWGLYVVFYYIGG